MQTRMSRPTSDPAEIQRWAQACSAMPAEILPGIVNGEPAVLHFFVPDVSRKANSADSCARLARLRIIDWDHFFAGLEAYGLAVSYEILPGGLPGRVFEILEAEGGSPHAPRHDSLD